MSENKLFDPEQKIALEFMTRIAHAASRAYMLEAEGLQTPVWDGLTEDAQSDLIDLAGAYMINPDSNKPNGAAQTVVIIDRIFHAVITEFVAATAARGKDNG